ncbi:hypothetical protein [Microbacterium awajiense]
MSDVAPDPPARRSRFLLVFLVVAVAVVVVVALVAVFVQREPAQYGEDTPEGTVQRYSQAVADGDVDAALGYLVSEVADDCSRVPVDAQDRRITLLESTDRGETATVEVLIVTIYGSGPLGADEYESESVFDLVRDDGGWLIRTAPWELTVCDQTRTR